MCVYVYIYNIFIKKSKKNVVIFLSYIYIFLRGFVFFFFLYIYCGGINSVFKISDFRRGTQNFQKIFFFCFQKKILKIP